MCEAIRQLRSQSRKEGEKAGSAKERRRFRAQLAEAYLAKEIALPAACRMAGMSESDFLALAAEGPMAGDGR